jgi:hypothetical protein
MEKLDSAPVLGEEASSGADPNFSAKPLNPYYVTGLSDAESSFIIGISKHKTCKTGYSVTAVFAIHLHFKDLVLLKQVQSFFGVGNITLYEKKGTALFSVNSISNIINVIIPHFAKYPLSTQKRADFELFKSVVHLINKKEHLTSEGLIKILSIKASMNKGLSDQLKAAFPDIIPVARPLVKGIEISDPNWVAGFTEGEGCFNVNILSSKTHKIGAQVQLRFELTQHSRDTELMNRLVKY